MLQEIRPVDELRALARARARPFEAKSVHKRLIDEEVENGWQLAKTGKTSARLKRQKSHHVLLEDRVWTLLYRMQFTHLSGRGGAQLAVDVRNPNGPKTQLDVVGLEDDLALAIECKSQERPSKRSGFAEELAKLGQIRERFSRAVNSPPLAGTHRRHTVLVFFLNNIELSKNDRERAAAANISTFDERDLEYYEKLVSHLGPAAKYQFFADMLPGKVVPGLEIRVPCVKSRLGGNNCYSFPLSPEYLLKISYVSHRTKGKRSDVDTYQRMLAKPRLKKIRQYISENGVFPTNIVVNIEARRLAFQRIKQDNTKEEQRDSGVLGWLDIKPAYKSAWIIDGQHRLYAYSGHPRAAKSHLTVLAFEGLPPSKQAQLFIDINAKQKSVKQSLLQELFAELHWDSEKPAIRVQAIVSKAVQILDSDVGSPLRGRIQTADSVKDSNRCISLTSVFNAIDRNRFHIEREVKGEVVKFGPLWAVGNDETLERTIEVIKSWLAEIRAHCQEWWDLGAAEGGGLAMNDGVTTCINVLRSVLDHLERKHPDRIGRLDNEDLTKACTPYARVLGKYFGSLSEAERKGFRELRGVQGQTARTRRCQSAIRAEYPDFSPAGLDDFLLLERQETNLKAKQAIDRIEVMLQKMVIDELKEEFGPGESEWWTLGVPKGVRVEIAKREQDDDSRRGGKEFYFDLIHYRAIAMDNWQLFEPLVADGKSGSKERRTKWMVSVNEKRNMIAHPSSGVALTVEQLAEIEGYERALRDRMSATNGGESEGDGPIDEDS